MSDHSSWFRGVLLGVLLAAGAVARADDFGEMRSDVTTWSVANTLVSTGLRYTDEGRIVTLGMRDRAHARDWASASGGLGFRVVVRVVPANAPAGADPAAYEPLVLTEASTWDVPHAATKTFSDGTQRLDLSLASREAPLTVVWSLSCHPESPVFRSSIAITNTGSRPVLLGAADGLDAGLTAAAGTLSALTVENFNWGHPETSFQTAETAIRPETTVAARTGPGGKHAAWIALRSAKWNAGLFAGWEWSGPGQLAASGGADGTVALDVGFAPATFAHALSPRETFTAPAAFLGFFAGSLDAAGAATRAFVARRIAPALPSPDFPWAGFDTWGYSLGIDASRIDGLIDRAAWLGVEVFTVDAGWFPRLGDWVAESAKFPAGLGPVAARAHAAGMRFGLWVALGAADPSSRVVLEHPDWVARVGGLPVGTDMGGVALCLADARARAWILGEVDRLVAGTSLDWLVHDFTVITACDEPGHGHQAGDGWWASTAGYYAVLDEIRRRHPKLVLENCWDGGSLFDFGMVARHDTSATSDRNDAYGNQRAVYGGTYLVPPRYLDKYVGDDGAPDTYRFLSALAGGPLLLMGRIDEWTPETDTAAKAAVGLFKQTRVTHRDGAIYHLTPQPGSAAVSALESYDAKTGAGTIVAWSASGGAPVPAPGAATKLVPVGLSASALYDVAVATELAPGRAAQAFPTETGASLMSGGIPLALSPVDGAALVTILKR